MLVRAVCAVVCAALLISAEPVIMGMGRHDFLGMSTVHRNLLGAKPDVPVYGDVYPVAIFWVFASVGTPPQQFPVALDTGSYTMDIPMVGCSTCPQQKPNNFYDMSKSSTGQTACPDGECTFSNSYQTCDLSDPSAVCTISGNYYQDQVSIGGLKPVSIVFGGVNYQTSNFDQFAVIAGVVGIAPSSGNQDVFTSLFTAGGLDAYMYSMCFTQGSKSNGTFVMGGIDSRLIASGQSVSYVSNANGFGGFNLAISDVLIGGVSAGAEFQGQVAILDSGTNVLLVTDEQFDAVKQVFLANCTANPLVGVCSGLVSNGSTLFDGTCYPLTESEIQAFPDLSFDLGSLTLTMHPKDYLVHRFYDNSKCFGILATGPGSETGLFIVGDTLMQNYLAVFDLQNNRIGWAPVNTDTCGSI